jgi:hypothetical protein
MISKANENLFLPQAVAKLLDKAGSHKHIGASEYELTWALQENLKGRLLSVEEIEMELSRGDGGV